MFDRHDLVVQANKLIMAPQKFSYEEKRFLLCLISKISPFDNEFQDYRVTYKEYGNFIGQHPDNVRIALPKVTKSIMSQVLEIEDEEEVLRQRVIIRKATHYKRLGYVDVRIDEELRDVLLELKERFTKYKLQSVLSMKSKHAIRLYEIIKANQFKEQRKFRLTWSDVPKEIRSEYPKEEIQKLLDTNYTRFIDFEKRVLIPAQREMKDYTDIAFDYEKVKVSRYVVAIDFFVKENIPVKRVEEERLVTKMPSLEEISNKTPREMAEIARRKIENMDRVKLCKMFQDKVKEKYGVDFQISMLEGISNEKIVEAMPFIGSWKITTRTQHSVTKYIMAVLKSK